MKERSDVAKTARHGMTRVVCFVSCLSVTGTRNNPTPSCRIYTPHIKIYIFLGVFQPPRGGTAPALGLFTGFIWGALGLVWGAMGHVLRPTVHEPWTMDENVWFCEHVLSTESVRWCKEHVHERQMRCVLRSWIGVLHHTCWSLVHRSSRELKTKLCEPWDLVSTT